MSAGPNNLLSLPLTVKLRIAIGSVEAVARHPSSKSDARRSRNMAAESTRPVAFADKDIAQKVG